MNRLLPLLLLLTGVWAGCGTADDLPAGFDSSEEPLPECEVDADCVAAGTNCCECPSYALPSASGWDTTCADVDCPEPGAADPAPECGNTMPVCTTGACVLTCTPLPCELTCDGELERDPFGCLQCACASPDGAPRASCSGDDECVRVPADCCGCEAGGADTAVHVSEVDAHYEQLGCGSQTCPGTNVCGSSLLPVCRAGICALSPGSGDVDPGEDPVDTGYCGARGYGPCTGGQVCVLNHPEAPEAGAAGVGTCRDP